MKFLATIAIAAVFAASAAAQSLEDRIAQPEAKANHADASVRL